MLTCDILMTHADEGNATVSNILFEDVELIGVYLALTIDCVRTLLLL